MVGIELLTTLIHTRVALMGLLIGIGTGIGIGIARPLTSIVLQAGTLVEPRS